MKSGIREEWIGVAAYFRLSALHELPGEHRVEVGRTRSQDDTVSEDLSIADQ